MENIVSKILAIKKYKIFLLLTLLYLILYYLYYARVFDYVVEHKTSINAQDDYISNYVKKGKVINWLLIILTVCFIYVRVFFVSLFLLTGTYLSKHVRISYSDIVRVVLLAEFVFLLRDMLIIGFTLLSDNPDKPLFDASFSLNFFLNNLLIQYPFMAFPFKSISLYLLAYIIVLTLLIRNYKTGFKDSLKFTCSYFGISYVIWLALAVSFNLYATN
jgi:hypothetical protein